MKIVSFGDVHMTTSNLALMGDVPNFGGPDDAGRVIGDVRRACPHVLALPGNLDRREVIPYLDESGVGFHGHGSVVGGVAIFGCGGSNITPFKTPTEFTEDEIAETLERGYAEVAGRRPLLMICHTPPFETRC